MAYSTGTLLASGGDVYTQLMDAIKAFAETHGWTTNSYINDYWAYDPADNYVGKRLHMQKSIGGNLRYVNIRSCRSQNPFHNYNYAKFSGLAIMGSTDYQATQVFNISQIYNNGGTPNKVTVVHNGSASFFENGDSVTIAGTGTCDGTFTVSGIGTTYFQIEHASVNQGAGGTATGPRTWDKEPGAWLTSTNTIGACLDGIPTDVVPYYLISNGDNIYLQVHTAQGYVGLAFGVTTTGHYFLAGSGGNYAQDTYSPKRNCLLYRGEDNTHEGTMKVLISGAWSASPCTYDIGIHLPKNHHSTSQVESNGGIAPVSLLLYCSPDQFKGNAPLIPCYIFVSTVSGRPLGYGRIPGILYVNMKNLASLTEVTYGSDTYKLFRQYAIDDAKDACGGLAFLIS